MSNQITLKIKCPVCGTESFVTVNEEDFNKYKEGALAQHAFPYLSTEDRECIISGLCVDCQNNIFVGED